MNLVMDQMKKALQKHIEFFETLRAGEHVYTRTTSEPDSDELEENTYRKGQRVEFL